MLFCNDKRVPRSPSHVCECTDCVGTGIHRHATGDSHLFLGRTEGMSCVSVWFTHVFSVQVATFSNRNSRIPQRETDHLPASCIRSSDVHLKDFPIHRFSAHSTFARCFSQSSLLFQLPVSPSHHPLLVIVQKREGAILLPSRRTDKTCRFVLSSLSSVGQRALFRGTVKSFALVTTRRHQWNPRNRSGNYQPVWFNLLLFLIKGNKLDAVLLVILLIHT